MCYETEFVFFVVRLVYRLSERLSKKFLDLRQDKIIWYTEMDGLVFFVYTDDGTFGEEGEYLLAIMLRIEKFDNLRPDGLEMILGICVVTCYDVYKHMTKKEFRKKD